MYDVYSSIFSRNELEMDHCVSFETGIFSTGRVDFLHQLGQLRVAYVESVRYRLSVYESKMFVESVVALSRIIGDT